MNPNVDVVDILSLKEFSPVPIGSVNGNWLTNFCDPTSGITYKGTYDQAAGVISSQIGAGIVQPDRVYVVDRDKPDWFDPVEGGDTVEDEFLDGKVFSLELRGVGFLEKGVEWDNDVEDGGWRLLNGVTFQSGEFYTVHFHPQISPIVSTPDAIARFCNGSQTISADTTLGPSLQRKLLLLESATSTLTITLDATYPENVLLILVTADGAQKQTTLIPPPTHHFYLNGGQIKYVMGQAETVYMVRNGSRWYLMPLTDRWAKVGTVVFGGIAGPNQIYASGQVISRSEYPAVLDYLIALNTQFPGSVLSSGWESNKTQWGWGDGSTTIQVPLLDGSFPRFLDLGAGVDADRNTADKENIVNSAQDWATVDHTHGISDNTSDVMIARKPGGPGGGFGLNSSPGGWEKALTHNTVGSNIPSDNLSTEVRPGNVGLPAIINV